MSERPLDPAGERYMSLATFRRNGREVRTPVWIASLGNDCYVFSEGDAGKVKRIRANGRARLAACDMRGRTRGEWLEARARVVHEADLVERAYQALLQKYGWQLRLANVVSRLNGRYDRRAMIELSLCPQEIGEP